MPLVTPKPNEEQDAFISRCMSNDSMQGEFPDQKQRTAVCHSQWRKAKSKTATVMTPITKSWMENAKGEIVKDAKEAKHRFFEVTVSGIEEDRDGEIMDQAAVTDMISQFKSGKIPMFTDHGVNQQTGMQSYSWKQMMGVWVDARQDGAHLKAVARLNGSHPDAEIFWNYMQEGMPIGFSIGAKPVEFVDEEMGIEQSTSSEINKGEKNNAPK